MVFTTYFAIVITFVYQNVGNHIFRSLHCLATNEFKYAFPISHNWLNIFNYVLRHKLKYVPSEH